MASGRSDVAQASTGVYPNPPIQTAPLNYAEGTSTVTFSFASYNYFDGWYNGFYGRNIRQLSGEFIE